MDAMNESTRSILAIMLIITALSGIYLFWGITRYQQNLDDRISENTEKTDILIQELIRQSNAVYEVRMDELLNDDRIIHAFRDRDRSRLYEVTLPWYTAFKDGNPYFSNIHFHLPGGVSFLRMHKPGEFGDDLRALRPIITAVHENRAPRTGYEIGKHGLFYRVAKPVFDGETYLGALEFGIRVEEIARHLEAVLGIRVARYIPDELLNDDFRTYCKSEIRVNGYSVNHYDNRRVFQAVLPVYTFGEPELRRFSHGHFHFLAYTSGQLENYAGTPLARFLIAHDMTRDIHAYQAFLRHSVFLTLALVAGAWLILHFSFGVYIRRITELNQTLELKVRERTRSLEQTSLQLGQVNLELNQIFNTAADGMRIVDKDFQVRRVNDTFVDLVGKPRKYLENRPCHDWFKGPHCFGPTCTLTRILEGESRIEMDVEKQMEGGETRAFLLTATPFTAPDGTVLGVVENFKDISERKLAHEKIAEHEEFLNTIMATIQAGVIVTDTKNPDIIDANPHAARLTGYQPENLIRRSAREFFFIDRPLIDRALAPGIPAVEDCLLTTRTGETRHIRLSAGQAVVRGKQYLVQSFSDITDIRELIVQQAVDIRKAKGILSMVNGIVPRFLPLTENLALHVSFESIPCHAEGGDHLLLRTIAGPSGSEVTHFSLKDQSGHEVNCILRSIFTDLVHNALLPVDGGREPESVMARLNHELSRSGFFRGEDFFTAMTGVLDHQTLEMTFLSTGHPPFLLVRDNRVTSLPETASPANHLPIPFPGVMAYTAQTLTLAPGDRLIFYTDGFSEMPLTHTGRVLSTAGLSRLVQEVLDRDGADIPVSQLMNTLLDAVCRMSRETVTTDESGSVNTSPDDVTLLGMEVEPMSPEFEMIIRPTCSDELAACITEILDKIFRLAENRAFTHFEKRIRMVLEEAVLNAWYHGNREDPEKSITIRFSSRNDFVFEIRDEGQGFDVRTLPDPTEEENISKTSGRGLFIIRHFADDVRFRQKGRHIIICIRKNGSLDDRKDKTQDSPIQLWQV